MAQEPQSKDADESPGPRRGGLLRNAIFNSGSYLIAVVVTVVVTPIMVTLLGFDGYGAFVLITGLIGYYSLLDFGLSQGVTRYVAEFRAKGALNEAAGLIVGALLFNSLVGLFAAIPIFLIAPKVVVWIQCPPSMAEEATLAVRIGAIGFVGSMISGTFASTLMGLERYDLTAMIETSSTVLQNTLIVVALYLGGGLVAAVSVAVAVTAGGMLIYLFLCIRSVPKIVHRPSFDWEILVSVGSYSFYLFAAKISNVLSVHGVRFFIAWQFGPSAVTLFSVPTKLLNAFGGLLSTASAVLFPYASRHGVTPDRRLDRVLSESAKAFAMVSIPGYIIIAGLAFPILSIWMGRVFALDSWLILIILAFSQMIASQSTVLNQIVSGRGHSRLLGLFGITALMCFAVFLPLFTFLWGLGGVAVGMLASAVVSVAVVFWKALPKLGMDVGSFLKDTYSPFPLLVIVGITVAVPAGFVARDTTLLMGLIAPVLLLSLAVKMWIADPETRGRIEQRLLRR